MRQKCVIYVKEASQECEENENCFQKQGFILLFGAKRVYCAYASGELRE
jgi:hypothetical protein